MSEMFPVSMRVTIISVGHDIGVTEIGKFTLCDIGRETAYDSRSEVGTKVPKGQKPLGALRKGR